MKVSDGVGWVLAILLIGFLIFPQEIGQKAADVKIAYDKQMANSSKSEGE